MNSHRPIAKDDLEFILGHLDKLISPREFSGERILLTGATGFFGKWLTQTLIGLEDRHRLGNQITILSRDPERALNESPWLKDRSEISWIEGDIRTFKTGARFSTIIHGAAAASRDLNENQPGVMFDTIVDGTKRILEIASESKCKRLQLMSSGAVYGPQPASLSHVPETYLGAPETTASNSAYGEAKRVAEFLATTASRRQGFHLSLPRCFAFVGAYLPLDTHFAAGNFMGDVLKKKPLSIGGDGTPLRSYLYAADLMVWLVTILLKSPSARPINVGSGSAVSIAELARTMHSVGCEIFPERKAMADPVRIAKTPDPSRPPERYVPSVERAENELGLKTWTDLPEALNKSLRWHLA